MTATQVATMGSQMTPEQRRRAIDGFLRDATPITRQLCELELAMPISFKLNADGSLGESLGRTLWPEWAKAQADILEKLLELMKATHFPTT